MQAYPFLWGKSENFVGWNCIAQPEFLRELEGPASRILGEAQAGIVLAPDEIRVVRGVDPRYGVLDIAYRRVPSPYTEKGGRPFDFIEGVVLRDRDPSLSFSSKDFDAARAAVQPQYEKFASASAESWSGDASWHSATIDIDGLSPKSPLKVIEANSRFLPPPSPTGKLAESAVESVGTWSERVSRTWAKPSAKTAVIFAAVAGVAVGAYALVRHHRYTQSQQEGLSRG